MSRKPAQQLDLIAPTASEQERIDAERDKREAMAQTLRSTPLSFVEVWVIQHNTPKHPGLYVMNRRFLFHGNNYMPKSTAEESKVVVSEDIEEVRRWIPSGLFRIVPKDDAVTIEYWI